MKLIKYYNDVVDCHVWTLRQRYVHPTEGERIAQLSFSLVAFNDMHEPRRFAARKTREHREWLRRSIANHVAGGELQW